MTAIKLKLKMDLRKRYLSDFGTGFWFHWDQLGRSFIIILTKLLI